MLRGEKPKLIVCGLSGIAENQTKWSRRGITLYGLDLYTEHEDEEMCDEPPIDQDHKLRD